MAIPYLDKAGLKSLWGLMKQKFLAIDATAKKAATLYYGTTSNSTTAMTVTISGITTYTVGMVVMLKMGATPSSGCTVNINGLGAKVLKYRAQTSGAYFTNGATYLFVYDGTYFQAIHSYDSNTTYGLATTAANGLMSADNKATINSISVATDADIDSLL